MRCEKALAVGILALMFMSASAHASITVRFVGAERYRDVEAGSSGSRDATLNALRRHFDTLGSRYLGMGLDLTVEVLDIDLAGERLPQGATSTRIITGATPPSISLRYTLRERGRFVRQSEVALSDLNFQMGSAARSGDRLAYEKEPLTDWFRTTFGAARRARS
jgi:hypothetical protein